MAAGVNNGGGSWITLLGRGSEGQPGPSTEAPKYENDTAGEHVPLQPLKPMFVILIVIQQGEPEDEVPGAPNEQLIQNAPDLLHGVRRSEDSDGGEHENQGTGAKRPSEVDYERTQDGGQVGEDLQHAVQSEGSGSECQCPVNVFSLTSTSSKDSLRGRGVRSCSHFCRCHKRARRRMQPS